MAMSSTRWESIDDELLRKLWEADQHMYPAPLLTYENLKSLRDACPELSMCLRGTRVESEGGEAIRGVIVVWPLPADTYWKQLLDHTIAEHDVKTHMMPPASEDKTGGKTSVGVHVYHIERSAVFQKGLKGASFTKVALQEVQDRIAELDKFKSWDVVGYSALVATLQGDAAFAKIGFRSVDTSSKEHEDSDKFCPRMLRLNGNSPFMPPEFLPLQ